MKDEDRAVLKEFIGRYDFSKRPSSFGDPRHCEECAEANRLLLEEDVLNLDPLKLTGYAMNTTDRQILSKAIHETGVQQIADGNGEHPRREDRKS